MTKQEPPRWLVSLISGHWRGVIVSVLGAMVTIAISLGYGIITPQHEIRRVDNRIDTLHVRFSSLAAQVDLQLKAINSQHAILVLSQDSSLRLIQGLVAVQCITLTRREAVLVQLPCTLRHQ